MSKQVPTIFRAIPDHIMSTSDPIRSEGRLREDELHWFPFTSVQGHLIYSQNDIAKMMWNQIQKKHEITYKLLNGENVGQ